jgi:U3 small nucleolar RNA-associated protein 10
MEEVVLCSVFTKDKKRGSCGDIIEVRDYANTVLKLITVWMSSSTYFKGITRLLDHSDSVVKRKVYFV